MASESLTIVHASPGRVRLKASQVKGNPSLAQQVQDELRGVSGVREVRANPLTGSILLLLDKVKMLEPEALAPLAAVLGKLFPEIETLELDPGPITGAGEAAPSPGGTPMQGLAGSVGALNARIAGLTGGIDLRLLLPMSLLYLGVRQLLTAKKTPAPAWYDYLWFGFSTFIMLNRPLVEGRTGAAEPQDAGD
jgi:hypothetical protein